VTKISIDFSGLTDFTERQWEALHATRSHRYVLYGGARGGGKSHLLRWFSLLFVLEQYKERQLKGVRVMLACEDYPSLQDRHLAKVRTEFPSWMGEMNEAAREYRVNETMGGGVIAFRNLDKPSKYQSAEFAAIAVDELTKNTRETFDILRGSLRWPGVNHTVFIGATNPGGPGHLWVKQLWLDDDMPVELRGKAEEFAFVRSLPVDNPHLEQSYWDELNSLPEGLRRAWVEGDWSVFAGQAFTGFRADRHVVKPFEIPAHWSMWRCVDWGYHAPFCCLWLAQDPDTRRVYVFRELYARAVTDAQQAKMIVNNTPEHACTVTWADPSMWAKKSAGDRVYSTADEYRQNGVVLTKGNNDRISGKRKVDRALANLEDGEPGLQIMSNCRNLIRTLPALPYDETKVEDVDTDAEDHAYDCLRYGLTQVRTTESRHKRERERMLLDPLVRHYQHILKTDSTAIPFAEI